MKIIYWIKRNILIIALVSLVVWILYCFIHGVSSPETKMWLQKPLSDIKIQDILILVLLHAWISRSGKCECKK